MNEEYFDILDAEGAMMGVKRLRSEAHARGLWHSVVHIYFFRTRGNATELLVHLRAKTKDLNPGKWDIRFGGHVKAGERIAQAVRGELNDETGITATMDDLITGPIRKAEYYPNNEFQHVFFYLCNGDEKKLDYKDGEVKDVRWMSEEEIRASMNKEPDFWAASVATLEDIVEILKEKLNKT